MANFRPFETVYSASRRKAATHSNAVCIGRAVSYTGALRGALSKMTERHYPRADVYSHTGRHLYTVLRQHGGIAIVRVHGLPL